MTCNQICIAIPEPHFSNLFPWVRTNEIVNPTEELKDYLDWRKNTSTLPKISKEKRITEIAIDYLERNFNGLSLFCFPSLRINKEMNTPSVSRLFTELFKEELKDGIRAVLFDYNLHQHADLLNFKPQGYITQKSSNRVVIFYSKLNLILIVRVASSDSISEESVNCSSDVKYFISVIRSVIEEKTVTILGVVACTSVERNDLKKTLILQFSSKFELYDVLFICKDDLKSYKTLNSWWRSKFVEYCSDKISQKDKDNEHVRQSDEATFKLIIGLTMLIIAKCDENLPTLESDTQKQIKTMILDPEQMNARDDEELKKIIIGGFGSGKSVVGREIVKSCYENSAEMSTLYYICCDHFSLFQCEMKKFTDSLKKDSNTNFKIVCENLLALWQSMCKDQEMSENNEISLPKILQYYSEKSSDKVNFVLDELPGEYVKEKDANQLKELFSLTLKESLVVFIPKSIVKNRSLYMGDEKQKLESNCFDEEKVGMKNITLEKSMRVTKRIQSLIDSAQDTISKSNTVLHQPINNFDQLSKIKSTHEQYNESNTNIKSLDECKFGVSAQDTVKKSSTDLDQQKTGSIKKFKKILKPLENIDFHAAHNTTQEEGISRVQPKVNATSVIGYHDYDLDQGASIIMNSQKVVKSNSYLETEFIFKSSIVGHSIEGEKPKIIFLPILNLTEERSGKILSVVFEKICFKNVRGTSVICNNMEEVRLVAYAIDNIENYQAVIYSPHLQKCSPTMEEKIFVTKQLMESKKNVLVADSRAMCGAESEVVIVFTNPEEYYLRHVIADVCARCNSYLIVMVLPSENKVSRNAGTIKEVIDNWVLKDIVQKIQVEIKDYCCYINDQCIEFKDRAVKKNFINYTEDKYLKINDENNAV